MPIESDIESDAREVLRALADRKNVILAGPPGTGKSRLLNQVRELFRWQQGTTGASLTGRIPVPPAGGPIPDWFPSPDQTDERAVFPTVFDQNTKYRDFMRGLVPKIDTAGAFAVTNGTLYRASLHSAREGNAALVIIDEINRGPAVAAFGSALVGLEADKRLPGSGAATTQTQYFEILGDSGESELFALPSDLYVLASMNEADTSVEPLDVAFLRRFHLHRLEPDPQVLRTHLGLPAVFNSPLPDTPATDQDWYEALARAFVKISDQILLGRGQAYQLGHGALMHAAAPHGSIAEVEAYVSIAWATLHAHVDEIFFGNTRALSDILCAELAASPYTLVEKVFAGQTVRRVLGPTKPLSKDLYQLLKLISAP